MIFDHFLMKFWSNFLSFFEDFSVFCVNFIYFWPIKCLLNVDISCLWQAFIRVNHAFYNVNLRLFSCVLKLTKVVTSLVLVYFIVLLIGNDLWRARITERTTNKEPSISVGRQPSSTLLIEQTNLTLGTQPGHAHTIISLQKENLYYVIGHNLISVSNKQRKQ